MSLVLAGCAVVFFSLIAFWKSNAIVFMVAGGASLLLGLYWFDVYTSDIGLTLSLVFIGYSLLCLGLAFRYIFWREDILEEK